MRYFFLLFLIFSFGQARADASAHPSGLKLPRFAALKSTEVNVRAGPGTRYPIQWIYRREGLPVEIIAEFDQWRKIRDADGGSGWVHKTMLDGKRAVVIRGKEAQVLRAGPGTDERRLFKAEPMVIGRLLECEKEWCRLQIGSHKGWLQRQFLWGVYPQEEVK